VNGSLHAYAAQRYFELTDFNAPAAGGGRQPRD